MASSLDTIVQGIRGVGAGFDTLGQARRDQAQIDLKNDEVQRKQEADRILKERVGDLVKERDAINEEVKSNPDFSMEDLIDRSNTLVKTATEIGKPELADALLKDPRDLITNREKNKRATAQATATEVKEKNRAKNEKIDLAFKERGEVRDLKDKYLKSEDTKNTRVKGDSFNAIDTYVSSGKSSAAGDMSLIFQYMKLLDPGSTVREGEQAQAEQARGVPDTIRNLYNKAVRGEKLTPEQRDDFATQAQSQYRTQLETQRELDDSTLEQLKQIAGDDQKKLKDLRAQILPKTASERLLELDAKEAKKAAKKKDQELTVGGENKPQGKVYGKKAADAIFANPQNQANFAKFQAEENAARAAKGLPPMNDSEKNQAIIQWGQSQGLTFRMDLP